MQRKHHQDEATEGLYGARKGSRENSEALFMTDWENGNTTYKNLEFREKGWSGKKEIVELDRSSEAVAKHLDI